MIDVETRGTIAAVSDAMHDIRAAEDDLRAEQSAAWQRYVARVDAILAFDFGPETDGDDGDQHRLLDGLRAHISELRLQTHLGAMEGEDLVNRVRIVLHRPPG
jgi:hypothetical protein